MQHQVSLMVKTNSYTNFYQLSQLISVNLQVIVNNIKVEEALKVNDLVGIPVSTEVYSHASPLSFQHGRRAYTMSSNSEEEEIRNLVIAIAENSGNPFLSEQDPTVLPVTTTMTDDSIAGDNRIAW